MAVDARPAVEHRGDDVAPEVVPAIAEPAVQGAPREDVDAQAREVAQRLARLLLPLGDRVLVVEREDAEPVGLADGHRLDRDRHVGALAAVLLDERAVVHLVDVVAGEDEHEVGARLVDRLAVRLDRVGGAAIPLARAVPRDVRLHDADAAGVAVEVPWPPDADVVVERARVVLRQDEHARDARVDAVREREVDDPVLAGERHGGLRPDPREQREALPFPAREDDGQRAAHSGRCYTAATRAATAGGTEARRPGAPA